MKNLFIAIFAFCVLSFVAGCKGDEPAETPRPGPADDAAPQSEEAALAQAKKEALDKANEAVALKIHLQTTVNNYERPVLLTLYANADGALQQAEAANSVKEANQAKALAEETRRRLQNILDTVAVAEEEEKDTELDY